VEWLATGDERTCEFCDALDGKVMSLGDNFLDKGDTMTGRDGGQMTADYEHIQYPPAHPDCRCTIIPVIK